MEEGRDVRTSTLVFFVFYTPSTPNPTGFSPSLATDETSTVSLLTSKETTPTSTWKSNFGEFGSPGPYHVPRVGS